MYIRSSELSFVCKCCVVSDVQYNTSLSCVVYCIQMYVCMYMPCVCLQVSCIVDGVKSGGVSAIPNFEAQLKSSEVVRDTHSSLPLVGIL